MEKINPIYLTHPMGQEAQRIIDEVNFVITLSGINLQEYLTECESLPIIYGVLLLNPPNKEYLLSTLEDMMEEDKLEYNGVASLNSLLDAFLSPDREIRREQADNFREYLTMWLEDSLTEFASAPIIFRVLAAEFSYNGEIFRGSHEPYGYNLTSYSKSYEVALNHARLSDSLSEHQTAPTHTNVSKVHFLPSVSNRHSVDINQIMFSLLKHSRLTQKLIDEFSWEQEVVVLSSSFIEEGDSVDISSPKYILNISRIDKMAKHIINSKTFTSNQLHTLRYLYPDNLLFKVKLIESYLQGTILRDKCNLKEIHLRNASKYLTKYLDEMDYTNHNNQNLTYLEMLLLTEINGSKVYKIPLTEANSLILKDSNQHPLILIGINDDHCEYIAFNINKQSRQNLTPSNLF